MADEIKSLGDLKDAVEGAGGAVEAAGTDVGNPGVVEEVTIAREPVRDDQGRSYATGKRKDAVARVWVKPGSGKVSVNGKEMPVYFARPVLQMVIGQAFKVAFEGRIRPGEPHQPND